MDILHDVWWDARMDELTQLTQQNQALIEENTSLKARIVQLEHDLAQARKNSSTSSKPPSSDIVKPPKPSPTSAASTTRSPGGQPGQAHLIAPIFYLTPWHQEIHREIYSK